MRKIHYSMLLTLLSVACVQAPSKQKEAIVSYAAAILAEKDSFSVDNPFTKEVYSFDGYEAIRSPSGLKVCFTRLGKSTDRAIYVADLITGEETAIATNNCYFPSWSSDGGKLCYSAFTGSNWQIRTSDPDGSNVRPLAMGYSPVWVEGRPWITLLSLDLKEVCVMDTSGVVLQHLSVDSLLGDSIGVSSNSRFLYYPDKEMMLFNADNYAVLTPQGYPCSMLYSYNMATKELLLLDEMGKEVMPFPVPLADSLYIQRYDAGFTMEKVALPWVGN